MHQLTKVVESGDNTAQGSPASASAGDTKQADVLDGASLTPASAPAPASTPAYADAPTVRDGAAGEPCPPEPTNSAIEVIPLRRAGTEYTLPHGALIPEFLHSQDWLRDFDADDEFRRFNISQSPFKPFICAVVVEKIFTNGAGSLKLTINWRAFSTSGYRFRMVPVSVLGSCSLNRRLGLWIHKDDARAAVLGHEEKFEKEKRAKDLAKEKAKATRKRKLDARKGELCPFSPPRTET